MNCMKNKNGRKNLILVIVLILTFTLISTELFASNSVNFTKSSDWGSGFVADINVTNTTSTVSDGWQVEFDFPFNITNIWSAEIVSHNGDHYIIKNAAWNGKIPPAGSVKFGFQGTPGNVTNPINMTSSFENEEPPPVGVPVANSDVAETDYNSSITVDVLSNDSGDDITIENIGEPANGNAQLFDSSIMYTPNNGFSGNDSFQYTISDSSGQVSEANVNITVNPPVLPAKPVANNDTATTEKNNAVELNVLGNDTGENISIDSVLAPTYGVAQILNGKIKYIPNNDFVGSDSFNYTIKDSANQTASAMANINVTDKTPTTFPPGFGYKITTDWGSGFNADITLTNLSASTSEGWSVEFDYPYNITQIWNAKIISHSGSHYVIGNVNWNGNVNSNSAVSFGFGGSPGNATEVPGNIKINMGGGEEPALPVANDDSVTVDNGDSITVNALDNDTGSGIKISSITDPNNGSATFSENNIVYTPDKDFTGNDSLQYTINDSDGNSSSANILFNVKASPVISLQANNDIATTYQDAEKVIDVLVNDTGNQINIQSNTQPENGVVSIENNKLKYVPNNGFSGNDSFQYTIADSDGEISIALVSMSVVKKSTLNKAIIGYWEAWNVTNLRLKDINTKYNVVCVSFGVPKDSSHVMIIHGLNEEDKALLKADILELQAQGKKIILSLGGAAHAITLDTVEQKNNFVNSVTDLVKEYNFDGIDIDIETISLKLDADDTDFKNPTTPKIVNLINGVKEICNNFTNKDFMLTAAPETTYIQPNFNPTTGHGAYLPILDGLRDQFTFIHPQFYNSGSMYGGDGQVYMPGTPDFLVALSEPLITGFEVRNVNNQYTHFDGFRADQIALGLLSTTSEGSGYMEWSEIQKALDYLIKGISFGGSYTLKNSSGYPDFRGVMTWSINCDKRDHDYAFANNSYEYFFGDEPVNLLPTVSFNSPVDGEVIELDSLSPVNISIAANDADGNITETAITVDGQTYDNTSVNWTPSDFGSFIITASGTDDMGGVSSKAITVTVQQADDNNDDDDGGGMNSLKVVNDSFNVSQDIAKTLNVLSNDTGNMLQIINVSGSEKGTVTISPDKSTIAYTNYFGAVGYDSFQYTVMDSENNTAVGNITLNIMKNSGSGYYHTSGNQILDSDNNPVRIEGISWFGFEATDRIPHGLWSRNYKEMMNQMKELGFNTIRLPYNNEMFDPGMMPSLNYWANSELEGLTPIQVMDKIVEYAGEIGLKIILDHHRSDTQDVGALGSGLWYTDKYPESRWINDWKMLAERYYGNSTVIGADIHNEPHTSANWGQGGANDWKAAAEKCGNAILTVNPNWLILVEGIESYNDDYYWWGGNLKGVKENPITLNTAGRVVYSPHIYPNSIWNQPWFSAADYPNNLTSKWDEEWGYIYKENIAPIIIGEFGSKFEDPKDLLWMNKLAGYLNAGQENGNAGISWLWWSWNPNSGDTGGILQNDWISVNQNKLDYLNSIRFGSDVQDDTHPTITFNYPINGSVIEQSSLTEINILIAADDNDGTIAATSISVDSQVFIQSNPNWTPSGFGAYTLVATATDNDGNIATKSISIIVQQSGNTGGGGLNIPPVIAFVSPSSEIIEQIAIEPINISITANDSDGNIVTTNISVENITSDSSTATWTPSSYNTYTILATAIDNLGAVTTASMTVTIQQSTSPIINKQKQVIGYFTQWDAWKGADYGFPAMGVCNQLNVDYSKYTMLNYSFFGVANDGSLHSGDFRNKLIYMENEVQQPAPLLYNDIYSSWDYWLLFGELPHTTASKANGAAKGLIQLCDENGVDLMASIGGWSMCKHFPEMSKDENKKAKFIAGCKELIALGFDGIDIDWEYPGAFKGMNFEGGNEDYVNFTNLMRDIRAAIGPDKKLTAAFSCSPEKLAGFQWSELNKYMDHYNIMSYDIAGGWSDITGHNSPLYAAEGQLSWDNTFKYLLSLGIAPEKINMGVAFYGRGVNTNGTAGLGTETLKRYETNDFGISSPPDGPLTTAADYTNWLGYYGQPDYRYIMRNKTGWNYHWDDVAKVPYMTKENYFLSYDNERSVQFKADYVVDNNIGGVIIWHVFGDWEVGPVERNYGNKLPYCPNTNTPLLDVLFHTFETNGDASHL